MDTEYLAYLEQLAATGKYAVLYGRGDSWPSRGDDKLLRALLVVSELRALEYGTSGSDAPEAFVALEIAGMFGFHNPITHDIYRYDQFFKWVATPEAQRYPEHVPAASDFSRLFGVSWQEYRAAGYVFWAYFRQFASIADLSNGDSLVDARTWINGFGGSKPLVDWYRENTWNLSDLRAEFEADTQKHYGGAWLLPLKKRPLFRVRDEIVCCLHVPFLENAITQGLFFKLADAYYAQDPKKSNNLRALFGRFFEIYVHHLFERVSKAQNLLCVGELKYGQGKRSSDVAIFDNGEAVFVEVVSSRFRQIETLMLQDPKFVDEDLERIVDKIQQLSERIQDFRRGEIQYDVDQSNVGLIRPIVVTSFALPQFIGIRDEISKRMEARSISLDPSPRIVEINILELLEQEFLAGANLFGLLKRWWDHPTGRRIALGNFVFFFAKELGLKTTLALPSEIAEVRKEILQLINSWPGKKKIQV